MDIFNLELPEENNKDKFPQLEYWFDFMNQQFEKIEESNHNQELNKILIDNNINID